MKKILAWMLAAMMVLGCGAAMADTFVHGIDPEYNPFSYMGPDGEYTGFDVEIARAACEVAGLDYEIFPVNWDTKEVQLDAHECDVIWSGMTIKQSMIDAGYVISAPYYDSTQVLVVRADSDIKSSADLAGKIVAVQLGTSGEDLLHGELADLTATFQELVTTENFLTAFTNLEGNAVDAVFVDLPVADKYAREHDTVTILDEELGKEQYGLLFRAEDQELCAKIEAAVQTLVENGTYAEIAAKYPSIENNLLFLQAK